MSLLNTYIVAKTSHLQHESPDSHYTTLGGILVCSCVTFLPGRQHRFDLDVLALLQIANGSASSINNAVYQGAGIYATSSSITQAVSEVAGWLGFDVTTTGHI